MNTDTMNMLKGLRGVVKVAPTGSRVICSPAPINTDEDYVIQVKNMDTNEITLTWNYFGSDDECKYPREHFLSFRKGNLNAIITDSYFFFDKFVAATEIARRLNLRDKKDRIMLFQGVLYGRIEDPNVPKAPAPSPIRRVNRGWHRW